MAEIKSAIELAMEKTTGFRLSREEKEKLKDEEVHAKAQGLVHRFLEVDLHFREVEKELAQYDPEEKSRLKKLMIQFLIQAILLDKENDLAFQGIERFKPGSSRAIDKMRTLTNDYQKRRNEEYEKVKGDLRTQLERQGISGSAVLPRVEGRPEWEGLLALLKAPFERELQGLMDELNR
ncbi:MAG: hypothetical protein NTY64_02725 [Deltaproteobacteria bacterium]|nr:hypothetical protein [Deltaproteobacteria bacterium]